MSTEKDPSIYHDRSAIGSSDELDEYGVWVKSEPQDVSSLDFDTGDLPGLTLPDSEELPDFDAGFDDTAVTDDEFAFPGEEEISFDDADHIPAVSDEVTDEVTIEDFDDLEAVRKDILEPQVTRSAPKTADADLSTHLLMQIAEELNSIKGELSNLKSELAAVKNAGPAISASPFSAPHQAEPPAGSFFDEDDDETIALTGDELDNILHTADFTEEAGADAIEGLTEDDIAALNDSDFKAPSNEIDLSILEPRDTEELAQLRDEGAQPITEAPEDTSYLENDPLAKEHGDGLSLDLSDAVIDEPDLSGEIVENPPEEPSPDALDINLDDFGELSLDDDASGASAEDAAVAVKSEPVEDDADITSGAADASDAFEEISFDDIGADAQTIDISSFDADSPSEPSFADVSLDDLDSGSGNDILADAVPQEDLTFEMLGEDAELPIKENVQDNVITDDSFETISLDDTIDLAETPTVEGTLDLIESIELEEAVVGLDAPAATDEIEEIGETGETIDLGLNLDDAFDLTADLTAVPEAPAADQPAVESAEAPAEDASSILGQILNQLNVELPPAEEAPAPEPAPEKPAGEDAGAILGQILGQLENAPDAQETAPAVSQAEKKSPKPKAPSRKRASKSKAAKVEEKKVEEKVEEVPESTEETVINTNKIPKAIKTELKTVLSYMDQLLESLPEDKIEEFAQSEYFETYKKLFEDLGIA